MADTSFLPAELREELEATVASVFSRAVTACDASSSLERTVSVRDAVVNSVNTVLANALSAPNSRLSLQDRLPPELWIAVWKELAMLDRFAVSYVCSRWRHIATTCPGLWTMIDCYCKLDHLPSEAQLIHGNDVHVQYATDHLVTTALERAKGLKLFLSFTIVPGCYCREVSLERLTAMLAPHARNIVAIHFISCPVQSAQVILSRLDSLSSLQTLEYTSITPWTYRYRRRMPPILSRSLFPQLETLDLPGTIAYSWPEVRPDDPPSDGQRFLSDHEPLFPALRQLNYAPSDEQDISRALRDCPNLSTLCLAMTMFECDEADARTLQRAASHIRCLDVFDMALILAQWILPMFATPYMRRLAVVARALPRIQPEYYVTGVDYHSDSEQGLSARALKKRAATVYRRLANATKTIFRGTDRSASAVGQPELCWTDPPVNHPYNNNGLRWLTSHFADLGTRVSLALHFDRDRATRHQTIALRGEDNHKHVRIAALQSCDIDALHELLAVTWKTYLPIEIITCFIVEATLFPLLLPSLPDVVCAGVLQLLFDCDADEGNGAVTSLEPVVGTRFPNLHALCFRPRDIAVLHADLEPVVISAQDVAVFANSLGTEMPLASIVVVDGIEVRDADALNCLSLSVVLHADPTTAFPI